MESTAFMVAKRIAAAIREDIRILSGDIMGPSDATWHDVAGTLQCNLEVLSRLVDRARAGGDNSFIPMLTEWILED